MIDFFGHVSYAAITLGILWLGQKKAYGWIMKSVGDAGWAALGIAMGMSSIILWASLFVVLDFIGWAQWQKTERARRLADAKNYDLGRGVLFTRKIAWSEFSPAATAQLAEDDGLDNALLREEL